MLIGRHLHWLTYTGSRYAVAGTVAHVLSVGSHNMKIVPEMAARVTSEKRRGCVAPTVKPMKTTDAHAIAMAKYFTPGRTARFCSNRRTSTSAA